MVLSDDDSFKPALYQDLVGNLVVGFFVIGFFEKLFLESLQSFVDTISGILLSASAHLCDVLLELRLIGGLIAKERVVLCQEKVQIKCDRFS